MATKIETKDREQVIAQATKIVEKFMTLYKEDFYNYDLKHFKECDDFLWSLRKTGTDVTKLKGMFKKEFFENLNIKDVQRNIKDMCVPAFHERNEIFYHVLNGKLIKKTKDQFMEILNKAIAREERELMESKLEPQN